VTTGQGTCEFASALLDHFEQGVALWPDPVADVLHVTGLVGPFRVHDALGRCVMEGMSSSIAHKGIVVSNWKSGHYVLIGNAGSVVQKFVVMR